MVAIDYTGFLRLSRDQAVQMAPWPFDILLTQLLISSKLAYLPAIVDVIFRRGNGLSGP